MSILNLGKLFLNRGTNTRKKNGNDMIANVWLSLNITTLNAMLQFLVIHRYRFLNLGKLFLNCRTNSRKKKKKK